MYKTLNEQELARYCSRKDRLAGDELYRRYAVPVYALCKRYVDVHVISREIPLSSEFQVFFVLPGENDGSHRV